MIEQMKLSAYDRQRIQKGEQEWHFLPFATDLQPGQCCLLYGAALLKMPKEIMGKMLAAAVHDASVAAVQLLNPRLNAKVQWQDVDHNTNSGETCVRMTVSNEDTGETATGTGRIPDPRVAKDLARLQWMKLPLAMPQPVMH